MEGTVKNDKTQTGDAPVMDSVVDFPTDQRLHISINVNDLWKSANFYRHIFDADPVRMEKGYAKFEVHEPAINFAINEFPNNVLPEGHFGIQLDSHDDLEKSFNRLSKAGFSILTEDGVACCYARQDKFWCADPDGYRWEFFVTTSQEDVDEGCGPDCICHQDIQRTVI